MPCLNIKESRLFGTRNIKSFRNTYFTFSEPHSGFEYSLHNSNSADHKIFLITQSFTTKKSVPNSTHSQKPKQIK